MKTLAEQRRKEIINKLEEKGNVKTSRLAKLLSVTENTIRRDLEILEEEGKLEKVHGGAVVSEKSSNTYDQDSTVITSEPSFEKKSKVHEKEKEKIGKKAASMIKDINSVFIGTGTTTMQIIENMDEKRGLTIATNSLKHGMKLTEMKNIEIMIAGGQLQIATFALVGPISKQSINQLYVDTLFLGVTGISRKKGFTVPSFRQADMARSLIEISNDVVIVSDSSKFSKISKAKVANIEDVDILVTDSNLGDNYQEIFSKLDLDLVLA